MATSMSKFAVQAQLSEIISLLDWRSVIGEESMNSHDECKKLQMTLVQEKEDIEKKYERLKEEVKVGRSSAPSPLPSAVRLIIVFSLICSLSLTSISSDSRTIHPPVQHACHF